MSTSIAVLSVLALTGTTLAENIRAEGGGGGADIPLVINSGWVYDQVDSPAEPSQNSPWTFFLDTPAYFRVTDYFLTGDSYSIFDNGPPLGSTALDFPHAPLGGGDPLGDAGWSDGSFEHFETILAPGPHFIVIFGSGQLPAGFYIRLDKVPAPGAAALLGLGGLVAVRRRR